MRPHTSSLRLCSGLFFVVLLFCGKSAFATHIVGGEMGYTCLGDNQYEIRLTIYRDCFFGNPQAYFDDPASIGIFSVNNVLLQEIQVDLMGDDTLSPVLTDECLVIPPDVCVHTTTYRTVVELLPRPGGYQLAYQRCCRNQTIANIIDPLATGATYGVTISERALQECNSSVEFLQWPPLYICANEPILFDQSAIDIDGDSIVYRLCTPLLGANTTIPRPQPPNPPPYQEVVWNDPPYNVNNMLNGFPGGVPLAINSQTGLLTGTPNTVGQFVVGICAEEYRNGELISTTRRDFQYNVGICGNTTAAFFSPEIQCDGLEVSVINQTVGTNSYLWIFGDPESPLGSSTVANPSFVFPDTGLYDITLVAAPGETCADTFSQQIQLLPLTLNPAFSIDTLSCGDSLVLQINDLSTDEFSEITTWEWSVNGEVFSNEQSPQLVISVEGSYTIELSLTAENGCQNAVANALSDVEFIREQLSADTLVICPGETINLNPIFIADLEYEWSPAGTLNNPNIPNPEAGPEETTTYDLVLTDPQSGCTADRRITVVVTEPLTVEVTPDLVTCDEEVQLVANSNNGVRHIWSTSPDFDEAVIEGENVVVSPIGEQTYYLLVVDAANCQLLDSVVVNSQAVNVELVTPDTGLCLGDQLLLEADNIDPEDMLTWQWEPADEVLSGQGTPAIVVEPVATGPHIFAINTANQFGCTGQDSLTVTVVDQEEFGVDIQTNQCSGNTVNFQSSDPAADLYIWHFGDPAAPGLSATGATVSHTYADPGIYQVQVSLPAYLACADTLTFPVEVLENGLIQPAFSWEYESCADTAVVVLNDNSTALETSIVAWEWIIGEAMFEGANQSITVDSSQQISVTLITYAENGCVDTIQDQINIELISFDFPEELVVCPGEAVELNPDGNISYSYAWSPGESLSDSTAVNPSASPIDDTIYSVLITDASGDCQRMADIAVNVAPVMEYTLSPDTTTCDESWLLFAESEQAVSYLWATDAGFNEALGNTETQLVDLLSDDLFYLQLTDEFGCQIVDSVAIMSEAIQVQIDAATNICVGDTTELQVVNLSNSPISSYTWAPQAGILSGQGTPVVSVSPSVSQLILLSLSNEYGCLLDTFTAVNVFQFQPPLTISPQADTLLPGESVQLFATNDPTYTYTWSPTMGLSATDIPDPVASPAETTTYTLTIVDENGCSNSAEVLLFLFDSPCVAPYIFVPNAFSPNGDNLNDVLLVEGNVIDEFYLAIYDRWGEQVFESRSQTDGWDGTFQGRTLAPDVYGYYLEVSCFGGEQYRSRGNITLLR